MCVCYIQALTNIGDFKYSNICTQHMYVDVCTQLYSNKKPLIVCSVQYTYNPSILMYSNAHDLFTDSLYVYLHNMLWVY